MINKNAVSKIIYVMIRWILGGLFVYAGARKLLNIDRFADNLVTYTMFPDPMITPLAYGVPVTEVFTGLALIADVRGALAVYGFLMVCFTGVLAYAIGLGLDMDCGCFGPENSPISKPGGLKRALNRNYVIMILVLTLYLLRARSGFIPVSIGFVYSKIMNLFQAAKR